MMARSLHLTDSLPVAPVSSASAASDTGLNVVMVTETWPPEINGVALTVAALARGLRVEGHAVRVVRPQQPPEREPQALAEIRELIVPGAQLPRYGSLRFGFPARRRLLAEFQRERPDALYVATEGPLGWSAVSAARTLGIPIATGFHTRFDDFVGHYGLGFLRNTAFAYLRRFHNRAQTTLVPTEPLRQELLAGGFRDVRILERGVDGELFHPGRRSLALRGAWGVADDELALLFVGRIAPEKNLDLVLATVDAIRNAGIKARMVWVGDGPARAALQAAYPDHVWCGMQRGEALGAHYASADVFLFPSLTETFGNVTLEALAAGLPTLAFAYGAAGRHIEDGVDGCVADFGHSEAYLRRAVELARDAALRQRIASAARAKAERLTTAAVSARFAELLRELAKETSR